MVRRENILNVPVIWRGNKFVLEMNSGASLNDFGEELQKLSDVRANTMRLIVPQSSTKGSKLLMPFSEEHSHLRLQDIAMPEGKPLRMMGVSEEEVDQILESAKANLRIAGFEEEEKRMKQLTSYKPQLPLKLPPGPYIFCDFRTLTLPGVQLNPPPSEALKRMHMLAADPGIVAIMNKHRWRVGVMTEMAPVGYVGISPKCILGLNKNHGEVISLRLRTDDLKGFRKYESIKKTLLHELAHMVYSEHDANFYALDKQLNQEAATLDWTRSKSHTLTGLRPPEQYDVDVDFESKSSLPYKLGGNTSNWPAVARSASVAAASSRLLVSENMNTTEEEKIILEKNQITLEPDPDDSETTGSMELKPHPEVFIERTRLEPDPDDAGMIQVVPVPKKSSEEPNPDDLGVIETNSQPMQIDNNMRGIREHDTEPDPDDVESKSNMPSNIRMFNEGEFTEPDPDEILANKVVHTEPDEPDLEDEEALRIQDPARVFCNRLATAVDNVLAEVSPSEQGTVLQTLVKIIRNVLEHPDDIKYKRLRKANRLFQTTVAKYKASMEILALIGFSEDVIFDETGKAETYLVLKRDDPGLLWLAKSFLETCI